MVVTYWYITGICATNTRKSHIGMQCCASNLIAFALSNKALISKEAVLLQFLTGATEVV